MRRVHRFSQVVYKTIAVVCGLEIWKREQEQDKTRKRKKEVALYIVLGHGGQGVVWHALEIAVVVVNVEIHLGIIWNPTPSLFDGLVRGKHVVVFESYLIRLWVGDSGPWVRFDSMGFALLGRLTGEKGESRGRRRR